MDSKIYSEEDINCIVDKKMKKSKWTYFFSAFKFLIFAYLILNYHEQQQIIQRRLDVTESILIRVVNENKTLKYDCDKHCEQVVEECKNILFDFAQKSIETKK